LYIHRCWKKVQQNPPSGEDEESIIFVHRLMFCFILLQSLSPDTPHIWTLHNDNVYLNIDVWKTYRLEDIAFIISELHYSAHHLHMWINNKN
jgi:hypothetical protein